MIFRITGRILNDNLGIDYSDLRLSKGFERFAWGWDTGLDRFLGHGDTLALIMGAMEHKP